MKKTLITILSVALVLTLSVSALADEVLLTTAPDYSTEKPDEDVWNDTMETVDPVDAPDVMEAPDVAEAPDTGAPDGADYDPATANDIDVADDAVLTDTPDVMETPDMGAPDGADYDPATANEIDVVGKGIDGEMTITSAPETGVATAPEKNGNGLTIGIVVACAFGLIAAVFMAKKKKA